MTSDENFVENEHVVSKKQALSLLFSVAVCVVIWKSLFYHYSLGKATDYLDCRNREVKAWAFVKKEKVFSE